MGAAPASQASVTPSPYLLHFLTCQTYLHRVPAPSPVHPHASCCQDEGNGAPQCTSLPRSCQPQKTPHGSFFLYSRENNSPSNLHWLPVASRIKSGFLGTASKPFTTWDNPTYGVHAPPAPNPPHFLHSSDPRVLAFPKNTTSFSSSFFYTFARVFTSGRKLVHPLPLPGALPLILKIPANKALPQWQPPRHLCPVPSPILSLPSDLNGIVAKTTALVP